MRGSKPRPVSFPVSALWLVYLLLLVGAAAVVWGLDHARDDLTARAESVLAAAGLDEVEVAVEGRDLHLGGRVGSQEQRGAALDLVGGLRGVRRLDARALGVEATDVTSPPAAVTATLDASITVEAKAGSATVAGLLRDDQDAAAVLAAVVASFGPGRVLNEIEVSPAVGPAPWLPAVVGALGRLAPLRNGIVEITPTVVRLQGTVADEASLAALLATFEATPLEVRERLAIGAVAPPRLLVSRTGPAGEVLIGGILANETVVTTLMARAVATFGVAGVVNETAIGLVEDATEVLAVADLLPAMQRLDSWSILLEHGDLSVEGRAADHATLDSVRSELRGLALPGLPFEPQLELTTEAVAEQLTELFAAIEVFEPASADLTEAARGLIDRAVEILNMNPSALLTVEGHTDNLGDAGINRELSLARADAIVVYLVAAGVERGRLAPVGMGEERPVASNATPEGRALNRRIEFVP